MSTLLYPRVWGHKTLLGLALSGALLGLSAAFLSQTRSNFIAMLILLMFLLVASPSRQRLVLAGLGSLTLAFCIGLDSRIGESLSNFWNGQFDQSVALRLEVWRHAFSLFLEAPITGVGAEQYATSVINSVDSGDLSSKIASCCARHAHNDLLQALAQRGLIGALAWLLVIVIPFTQFVRLIGHENPRVAHLATAGALIPLAYLGFGLTEATFEHGIYVTFYLVSITVLTHLTWRSGHEPP